MIPGQARDNVVPSTPGSTQYQYGLLLEIFFKELILTRDITLQPSQPALCMQLLSTNADGGFSLTRFIGNDIPNYAILSHTWETDDQEVIYSDLINNVGSSKIGYRKIKFCGAQAKKDDFQYFWVDSCCIDKSSSAELQTAINSMFRWYQNAAKCYVYLSDVSAGKDWELAFKKSRWFTRGWTLQELLAPQSVEFYSQDGKRLGNKDSLKQQIHEITGIAVEALQGQLSQFSDSERRMWAANRETTIEEDQVYCLLGIFDVYLPLIYGEGKENAFRRLQDEIDRRSGDMLGKSTENLVHALSWTDNDVAAATNRHIQVSQNLQRQNEQFTASQNDQTRAEIQSFAKTVLELNAGVNQNLATILEVVGRLAAEKSLEGVVQFNNSTTSSHYDQTEVANSEIMFLEELYRKRSASLSSRGAPRTVQSPIVTNVRSNTWMYSIKLGLQYSTAYTQVAYSSGRPANWPSDIPPDIRMIDDWPGEYRHEGGAVPSRIAYASDNPDLPRDQIGNQVTPSMASYSYTKPLLCLPELAALLSDGDAGKIETSGAFKLPKHKKVTEVVADYLRELRRHALDCLEKRLSSQIVADTPIEVWVAVPAMWSNKARDALISAVRSAGFASRASDSVSMITEPEAAALASFEDSVDTSKYFGIGDCIVVCDCGSTSTDVTCHTISKMSPSLKLEECMDGVGLKVGTLSVIQNFSTWMQREFGSAFTTLPTQRTGPGSPFIEQFETLITSQFRGAPRKKYHITLRMSVSDSTRYEDDELMITGQEIIEFYGPVVEKIITVVDQQSRRGRRLLADGKKTGVILVGALSSSPYLKTAFEKWAHSQEGIRLILPSFGQVATVRGAVLRGLQCPVISSRKSRFHFGLLVGQPFLPGTDQDSTLYYHSWSLSKMCNNRITWLIERGQDIDVTTHVIAPLWRDFRKDEKLDIEINLLSCPYDDAPETYPNDRIKIIGTIRNEIRQVRELEDFEMRRRSNGMRIWRTSFNFHITFSDLGMMQFQLTGRLTSTDGFEFGRITTDKI